MKVAIKPILCVLALGFSAASVDAWHLVGRVKCPNQLVVEGVVINVTGSTALGAVDTSGATDSLGNYYIELPDAPGSYTAELDSSTLPDGSSVVGATSVPFALTDANRTLRIDWNLGPPEPLC